MADDHYEGPGEIQFDGSTLADAKNVKVDYTSNATPVMTFAGYRGASLGVGMTELSVDTAVAKAGMEADFIEKCFSGAKCDIVVVFGGKRRSHAATIKTVSTSSSSEAEGTASFTAFSGKPRIL